MNGKELFQHYVQQPPEQLKQYLHTLTWGDVQSIGAEMTRLVEEARDRGDADAAIDLVSKSLPFLEYFEEK